MAKEDPKPKRKRGWAWLGVAAILFAVLLYYYWQYPYAQIGPKQPISFSHRVHAGVKEINCRFCHPYVERSQHAGLPPVEKCFFCHEYVIPNHPEIQKEKQYLLAKTPVPWVRIFILPDFVFFRHEPHVGWAKLDCSNCHGDVKTQDRLQTKVFQMGFCIGCHRQLNAQLDCWLACHR
jgi:predicted CXXCH cytochrome family protein